MVFAALLSLGFGLLPGDPAEQPKTASQNDAVKVAVHKSPTCGCCEVWASYMDRRGYNTGVRETSNLESIKTDLGVPAELASCHTSEVGGYVVEGHIPDKAIEKLLAEQPDIEGIGMAGMPAGSPGMPGPKTGEFVIYEITDKGDTGDVFMTI